MAKKILIADDHAIVRQGLRRIIEDIPGLEVAGETTNANETMTLLRGNHFDLVILDINMPGRSGLDILAEIHRQKPKLPILILTMHPEEQFAVRVLRLGASGYLTKDGSPDEIAEAIKKILSGKKYISSSLSQIIIEDLAAEKQKLPHEILSDREYEVFLLLAKGKTLSEVGDILSLSVKTISTYRNRIAEKTGLKSGADIIHYAIRNGIIQ
jgi:DNA-binding NarL/FixJ family response regulator